MPSSDLHKRLDHLISYSSQLIFINTGPQTSVQSQTADKLLAQQSEHADVAVINALPAMQADEFRQQLGQQLLGGQNHHARQPLPRLLSPLSQFTESVLICILHAQNLPEIILQECWQLVLLHNKNVSEQNINILLFADANWTEAAKERLVIDDLQRPVVLNIAPPEAVAQESELELLISQKRQAFAQRLQERETSPELVATSLLHKPWFWPLAGLLFVSIFAALLLILYPQFPANILASKDDAVTNSTDFAGEQEPDPGLPVVVAVNIPPEDTKQHSETPAAETSQAASTGAALAGDALVSTWQSETARIDQAEVDRQQDEMTALDGSGHQANEAASEVSPATEIPAGMNAIPDTDIQGAPDKQKKVQVGVLRKPFTEQALPTTSKVNSGIGPNVSRKNPTTAVKINLTGPSYHYNERALLALTPGGYVLQVIGLGSLQAMDNYIQTNQLTPHVWIYKTRRYGNDWYVLLNNHYYPSLATAVQAVDSLPESMRQTTPFPKSMEKVQQEIRNP